MSQDHLGNLQWSSQDLSSFLHETILSIHVGWGPMIHLHEKMKVVQQSDFFSMSLFESRQVGIFFHTRIRQDHTSQDHFCSVIDEFPVWNSEPINPRWWVEQVPLSVKRWQSSPEIRHIDDRSLSFTGEWRRDLSSEWLYLSEGN